MALGHILGHFLGHFLDIFKMKYHAWLKGPGRYTQIRVSRLCVDRLENIAELKKSLIAILYSYIRVLFFKLCHFRLSTLILKRSKLDKLCFFLDREEIHNYFI